MYKFSWDSTAFDGQLGAAHALEIPFTFNMLDRPGVTLFIGTGPRPDALAQTMHDAWASFIKTGDPSTSTLGEWPIYNSETRTVMNFDEECSLLFDPETEERTLWHQLR
jgi:para-nitrobenzyl esterase